MAVEKIRRIVEYLIVSSSWFAPVGALINQATPRRNLMKIRLDRG